MSIFEIQRLQGLTPPSPLASRDGKGVDKPAIQDAGSKPSATASGGITVEVSKIAEAGEPPVADSRVAEIREALRDGSYPLVPTEIADAMIAARLGMGLGE